VVAVASHLGLTVTDHPARISDKGTTMTKAPQRPIGSTVFNFATSMVIAIRIEGSELPASAEVDEITFAMVFTDVEEARKYASQIDGATVAQLSMLDLIGLLPESWGVIVDVDAVAPLTVLPNQKSDVLVAGSAFPPGASIEINDLADHVRADFADLLPELAVVNGLVSAHIVWHQVSDAREDVLVIARGGADCDWDALAGAVQSWTTAHKPTFPLAVVDESTIPADFQAWLAERIPEYPPAAA